MPGNTKSKGTSGKKVARGKAAVKEYTTKRWNKADSSFHIKLKHVLGGVSLLSLLAAFEVFSIPALTWEIKDPLILLKCSCQGDIACMRPSALNAMV